MTGGFVGRLAELNRLSALDLVGMDSGTSVALAEASSGTSPGHSIEQTTRASCAMSARCANYSPT
jgi:hypothetical protein